VRYWVTKIEPGHLIEWTTGLVDAGEPVGHVYGWRIEPGDGDSCTVVNYTDWSGVEPAERRERWPIVPLAMMERSVDNLEQLVTDAPRP
jgi:hypothetical protein